MFGVNVYPLEMVEVQLIIYGTVRTATAAGTSNNVESISVGRGKPAQGKHGQGASN